MNKYKLNKSEIIDQLLHVIIGAIGTFILIIFLNIYLSFIIIMALVLLREVIQHKGFKLGIGSFIDIGFFLIGSVSIIIFSIMK